MIKHKIHHGESLNLNWQTTLAVGTRITVGKGTFYKLPDILGQINVGTKILLLVQPNLFIQEIEHIKTELHAKGYSVHMLELPDGEDCKSTDQLMQIWDLLHELKFLRQDTIVAVGGGTVTDVAGFAASTYLRGINLVTIPTTVLAQIDAAIGGKTGINFHAGKNLIGSFYFAKAIIVDNNLLATLPEEQFISGLAEIIKTALLEKTIAAESEYSIGQKTLLEVLEESVGTLSWDNDLLPGILIACIKMKLAVVAKDAKESGLRRCLNLGHTLGHALESVSNFSLSHGEAVAIGMVFALDMSISREQISKASRHKIISLIEASGLPIRIPNDVDRAKILDILLRDKKGEAKGIKMILPKNELGIVEYNELIKKQEIEEALVQFV